MLPKEDSVLRENGSTLNRAASKEGGIACSGFSPVFLIEAGKS